MGWWTGIREGIKAIFGSSNGTSNIMEAAKGIGNFIDEQKLTDEERVKYNAQAIEQYGKFMENTIAENSQRSVTRRDLALWIIRNWFIMLWVSIVSYGIENTFDLSHNFSKFVYNMSTMEAMSYLVLGVGAFFFGAHIVRQVKGT